MSSFFIFVAWTLGFMGTAFLTEKELKNTPQVLLIENEKTVLENDYTLEDDTTDNETFDENNILNKQSKVKTICSNKKIKSDDKRHCDRINKMLFCIKYGQSKEAVKKARERIATETASKKDVQTTAIESFCDYDNKIHYFMNERDFGSIKFHIKELLENESKKRKTYELEQIIADIEKTDSQWHGK